MRSFFEAVDPSWKAAGVRVCLGAAGVMKAGDLWWRLGVDLPLVVWMVLSLALLVGFAPRVAGIGLFATFYWYSYAGQYANHFAFLAIAALLLSLVDSGGRWSVSRRRVDEVARWPLTLIQIHLFTVYFYSGLFKVNPGWVTGEYLASRFETALLWPWALPPWWLLASLGTATVLWELSAPAGLWWHRTRGLYLVAGVFAHVGMMVVLSDTWIRVWRLGVFAVAVFATYVTFVDQRWLRWVGSVSLGRDLSVSRSGRAPSGRSTR